MRDRVPYSAYLFYKFGQHHEDPGYPTDDWGEALTHEQMVAQARRMIEEFGFGSIKLKAGVFEPDFEIETLRASEAARSPTTPCASTPMAAGPSRPRGA